MKGFPGGEGPQGPVGLLGLPGDDGPDGFKGAKVLYIGHYPEENIFSQEIVLLYYKNGHLNVTIT